MLDEARHAMTILAPAERALQQTFIRDGGVVVDVGANVGRWTQSALEVKPRATYHLFEPSPATFATLRTELAGAIAEGRIHCNNVALGEKAGVLVLHEYPGQSTLNTIHRRLSVEQSLHLSTPQPRDIPVLSLDSYCAAAGLPLINFLKIDVEGHELAVLRGARRLLSRRMVDFIQLEYGGTYKDAGTRLAEVFDELGRHGYLMFELRGDELIHHPSFQPALENFQYALYLAVSPRLRRHLLGGEPKMFDYQTLFARHGIAPRGVVHVGAHEGEELAGYARAGCTEVLFIEGDPATHARLQQRMAENKGVRCLQALVSDTTGTATFHRMSFDQSSSLLPLKKHAQLYPSITESSTVELPTVTLDELLEREKIERAGMNVLAVDVQGAELKVLAGASRTLAAMDAVLVEVNYDELYQGGALVQELDALLEPLGFQRVEETCPYDASWGDALYVRRPRITMSTLGRNGRFANQMFQYFFLELAAERIGGVVETPPWIGESLFSIQSPRPAGNYQVIVQNLHDPDPESLLGSLPRRANVDLWGYFQYHTRHFQDRRAQFQKRFTPRGEIGRALDAALARARGDRRTMVALHLRRGDYGQGKFFVAPSQWYLQALEEMWPHLDAPWLYLASDEPEKVAADFARYAPVTDADLGLDLGPASFYADFYALSQANVVGISNSSFSFAAAMLNERGSIFLRPDPDLARLIPFAPWSSPVLLLPESYRREVVTVEALLAEGKTGEARARLEAYLARFPKVAEAENDLAVVLHLEGDLPAALLASERALALSPRDPAYHRNRAAIALDLGDVAEAGRSLEQALRVRGNDPETLLLAGDLSVALGRPEEARGFYVQAAATPAMAGEAIARLERLAAHLPSQELPVSAALTPDAPPAPERRQ